ncbi:MAG: hypothetical protein VZR54_07165 [Ruminococcus sp.]|nr:hypothetical protein [Ruminococcus sp.]
MKEVSKTLSYKGRDYKIVFNLNVIEAIQKEYGSLEAWGDLTDGKKKDEKGKKVDTEVDFSALIFGIMEAVNEGIDIDNEDREEKLPFLTHRQVARMISELGQEKVTEELNNLVIESTKTTTDEDDEKNA